jgi:hypothetical protein
MVWISEGLDTNVVFSGSYSLLNGSGVFQVLPSGLKGAKNKKPPIAAPSKYKWFSV